MDIYSDQEVWLRAYTAALGGYYAGTTHAIDTEYISGVAYEAADQAVKDFAKRFPPFEFASEENKK
jgi:hypothetical protein